MSGDRLTAALEEIRQREQAATPGPWRLETDHCDCGDGYGCPHGEFPYAFHLPVAHTEREPGDEHRPYDFTYSEVAQFSMGSAEFIAAARTDVPRLLAALDAVLALHRKQERPVRSYGLAGRCAKHRNPDSLRSALLDQCPDCTYTEYYVCSHCDCPNDEWPCPTYRAISRALLGEENGDG